MMEWLVALFAIWGVASFIGLLIFGWLMYSADELDDLDDLINDRHIKRKLHIISTTEARRDARIGTK